MKLSARSEALVDVAEPRNASPRVVMKDDDLEKFII
jgi:hypothetical protein